MKTILILSYVVLLSGCATILQPGPDRVMVNSNPEGAKVLLDGQVVGRTPVMVSINRKDEGIFTMELEGYETAVIDRDKVMSGWIFGNLILGGGIGIIVDLCTHNQGHYQEEPIYKELTSKAHPKQALK